MKIALLVLLCVLTYVFARSPECTACVLKICEDECRETLAGFLAACDFCDGSNPANCESDTCQESIGGCIPKDDCLGVYEQFFQLQCAGENNQRSCINAKLESPVCCDVCGADNVNCAPSCKQDECIKEVFSGQTQEACINAAKEKFKTSNANQNGKEVQFHKDIEDCKITCEQRVAVQQCLEMLPADDATKCTIYPWSIAIFHQHNCLEKIQQIHKDCTGANPSNPTSCEQRYDAWKKLCLYSEICVREAEQKLTTCNNNCNTALTNAITACRNTCKYTIPWNNCFDHCHTHRRKCNKICHGECGPKLNAYHQCRNGCFNTCSVQRKICGRRCTLTCRNHRHHHHHHHGHHHHHHGHHHHHHHHHHYHGKHHHHHRRCLRKCNRQCNIARNGCRRECNVKCKPLYGEYVACYKGCQKNCIYNKWNCKDRCEKANYRCFRKCKRQAKQNNKNCLAGCQAGYDAEVQNCKCQLNIPAPNPALAPVLTLSGATTQCSQCLNNIVYQARLNCPIAGSNCLQCLGQCRTDCLYEQRVLRASKECFKKQGWRRNICAGCCGTQGPCAGNKICTKC